MKLSVLAYISHGLRRGLRAMLHRLILCVHMKWIGSYNVPYKEMNETEQNIQDVFCIFLEGKREKDFQLSFVFNKFEESTICIPVYCNCALHFYKIYIHV